MLALTDAALAHLAIAATRVDPRRRGQWLRDLAAKLDPPNVSITNVTPRQRTPAAQRQARVRQRRKNHQHMYRLELRDRCVEGLTEMMLSAGRLATH